MSKVHLEVVPDTIRMDDERVICIAKTCSALRESRSSFNRLFFKKTANSSGKEFDYKLFTTGPEHFFQMLTFDVGKDPGMTWDVNGSWRFSEFGRIRDCLMDLLDAYPSLDKVEVILLP